MLVELRVENLGIIPELQLVTGPGMTAITGETGVGKTLLVEALALLLGGRADSSLVREGAAEARVEGRFVDGDGELEVEVVLARVVPRDGRSRADVDGRIATVAELTEHGRRLVDLHGQHDQQSLLVPAEQRNLLDAFAGEPATEARRAVRETRAVITEIDERLAALGGDERARAREIDLLRFQIEEIDAAGVGSADEDARLAQEIERLGDATAHRDALEAAYAALDRASTDGVEVAITQLQGRAPLQALVDRLGGLDAELRDVVHDVRVARDEMVDDPERLEAAVSRQRALRELRRKYGDTLGEVIAFADEARRRLDELESYSARVARLEADREAAVGELDARYRILHDLRVAAAPRLAAEVTAHLHDLALAHATFSIAVEPGEPGEDGADVVTFLMAPNPGEPARPLARAASGGELSRAMLAIRVVLSHAPPTLVFDEVDAGIGGEAGIAIGRALAALTPRHQVLCVTHLAQVAAAAHHQVHVSKGERAGRTIAHAGVLDGDRRVDELSRMLGGVGASESARAHARELLAQAGAAASAPAKPERARRAKAKR